LSDSLRSPQRRRRHAASPARLFLYIGPPENIACVGIKINFFLRTSTMLFWLATLAIPLRINNSTWRFCLAVATFLRRESRSGDLCAASPLQPTEAANVY
jgi:hypothetical protein